MTDEQRAIADRVRRRWSVEDIERDNAAAMLEQLTERYTLPPLEATARLCALFGAATVDGWLRAIRAARER